MRNIIFIGGTILLLLVVGGFLVWQNSHLMTSSENQNATTTAPTSTPTTNTPETMQVGIGLIDVDDGGVNGRLIGCNDSVVLQERTVPYSMAPLMAALTELLSLTEANDPEADYYNALYQSDLTLESVSITDGTATINLEGQVMLGGTCDTPRFEEQLRETALQFDTVDEVEIFINEEPIDEVLSSQ